MPGVGAFQLAADALAGAGDVAALLGDREVRVPCVCVAEGGLPAHMHGWPWVVFLLARLRLRGSCQPVALRAGLSAWLAWHLSGPRLMLGTRDMLTVPLRAHWLHRCSWK